MNPIAALLLVAVTAWHPKTKATSTRAALTTTTPLAYAAVFGTHFPRFESTGPGNCQPNTGLPERGLWFCKIQTRIADPGLPWQDLWTLGASRRDTSGTVAGDSVRFGIPFQNGRAMWFRIACVDSAGNVACWSESTYRAP
jgi:hypothetical protein